MRSQQGKGAAFLIRLGPKRAAMLQWQALFGAVRDGHEQTCGAFSHEH